jgi:DNA-binding response OmpR family regulator
VDGYQFNQQLEMNSGKILVVDDDESILDAIGMILTTEGYDVDLLPTGEEIFNHIQSFHPDLIILDVMLGTVDGRDLCNKIKSTESTTHIPIIMISATHNLKEMIHERCTPDEYISKPFDMDNLINKVQSTIEA